MAHMTLNDYQDQAMTTCTKSSENFAYMMMNLVGEVGEFASKVAKSIRKEHFEISYGNRYIRTVQVDLDTECDTLLGLKKEAGDILWQLSGLCAVMGWTLEDVARMNLEKLAERKKNGTIIGSGDGVTREERNA